MVVSSIIRTNEMDHPKAQRRVRGGKPSEAHIADHICATKWQEEASFHVLLHM